MSVRFMSVRFMSVTLRMRRLKLLRLKFFMRRVFMRPISMLKAMLRVNKEHKSAWLHWGSTVHHASVWRAGGMSSGAQAGFWKGRVINADVFYINGAG